MPSNVENILNGILTGDGSGIQKPASRVEELLFEIYEQGGGGGDSVIGGIKLTIDENYVMTATLVDKDGEEYGVSDDVDLPLEEMVVDAEYDPQTQKIKLELKNGNYVEFSVAELVSGLQTELSSSNKLNPAYIAYDASHRAVSDTEKDTWNAKQNAISDLEAIRSGAAAGATAVQPSALETALSTKQDTISDLAAIRSGASAGASAVQPETMSTALALKQDSLSEAQLAAVNSGINSTKVEQISTNQTNILSVKDATEELVDDGAKNLFDVNTTAIGSNNGGNISISGNTITITGGSPWAKGYIGFIVEPDKDYAIRFTVTSNDSSNVYIMVGQSQTSAIYSKTLSDGQTGSFEGTFHSPENTTELNLYISVNNTSASVSPDKTIVLTDVMVTTKAKYDISPTYEPHAKSNAQLTRDCTVNNSRIYAQATEPTDTDIPEGSTWANGASVRGYERTDNLFDEKYTGITSATVGTTYYPIQVGTGDFTLSSTTPNSEGTGSLLFLLAGNVSDGASSHTNGVYNGMSRTVTAVDGYVTVAYRYDSNYNPKNYQTMLNAGSSALPYAPYLKWQADPALVEVVDEGAKNKLKLDKDSIKSLNSGGSWSGYVYTPTTAPNLTVTINDDSTVTLNGSTSSSLVTVALERKASRGFQGYVLSGSTTNTKLVYQLAVSPYTVYATVDGAGSAVIDNYTDGSTIQLSLQIVANSTFSNTVITPMICTEADWNVSQKHVPPALPNYDLTVLESEDRAALVDAVDNGDKNKLDFASLSNPTLNNATVTKTDSSIVVTSSGAYARAVYSFDLKAGTYKLRLSASDITNASGSNTAMFVGLYKSSSITTNNELCRIYCTTAGDKYVEFNHAGGTVYVAFYINTSSTSYTNSYTISQMMICTEADWKVSQNYAPYALPNTDLTRMVGTLFPTTYTAPVVNSDISSKLSILSGGYAKAGNLVTVNFRLSVIDTIAAGSALFTGLPEPKTTAELSYGSAVVPVTNMCVNAQVSPNVMSIDTQGTIRLAVTPVSSDITTGIYILSATYLSA